MTNKSAKILLEAFTRTDEQIPEVTEEMISYFNSQIFKMPEFADRDYKDLEALEAKAQLCRGQVSHILGLTP